MDTIPYKHLKISSEVGQEADYEQFKTMLETYAAPIEQYMKDHPSAQKEAAAIQIDKSPDHPIFFSAIYRNEEMYLGYAELTNGKIDIKDERTLQEASILHKEDMIGLGLRVENAGKSLYFALDNHKLTCAWEEHIERSIAKEEYALSRKQGFDPDLAKEKVNKILHELANKDYVSYLHSIRVANLVKEYCERMNMPQNIIAEYTYGGMLHDIGKTKIEDRILKKPGRLETWEIQTMQLHTTRGIARLDDNLKTSSIIANMIQHHHEAYAGNRGYPDNSMHAHNIPLCARIASVCDYYDALSSKRQYKEAYPQEAVLEMMREEEKLDPAIVERFIEMIQEKEIVKQSNIVKMERKEEITDSESVMSGALNRLKANRIFNDQDIKKLSDVVSTVGENREKIKAQAKELELSAQQEKTA